MPKNAKAARVENTGTVVAAQESGQRIVTMIRKIKKSAESLNTMVQTCAVAIIEHSNNFGDCTKAALLVDAIPMTHRRSLVIDFFQTYSPIRLRKQADGTMRANLARPEQEGFTPFNIEGAKANPWYESERVPNEPGIWTITDVDDKVINMADAIERKIKRGQVEPGDVPQARAMAASLRLVAKQQQAGKLIVDEPPVPVQNPEPTEERADEPVSAVG